MAVASACGGVLEELLPSSKSGGGGGEDLLTGVTRQPAAAREVVYCRQGQI